MTGSLKYIAIFIGFILADFYIFPVCLTVSESANTKMLMAALGLVCLFVNMSKQKADFINRSFLTLSFWAAAVSLAGYMAVVINATNDYTYATYIVSMWVWIMAAYFLMLCLKEIHNGLTVHIIINYVVAVCIFQSVFALLYEYATHFREFIDGLNIGLRLVYETKGRMQGLGAVLDPAGIRFAASVVLLGYILFDREYDKNFLRDTIIYLSAFILITVVGDMISRTTAVGAVLALAYWIYKSFAGPSASRRQLVKIWGILGLIMFITIPFITYKYNTDYQTHENIRFGFEGFFSLAEKGTWEVNSNEILKSMVVFPDNAKTWIIGDGYIENPSFGRDPFYVGEIYNGYYKATDIGYLRFIFYFGLVGLFCFIGFFIYAAKSCMDRFPKHKMLFFMLLMLNFIVWLKVSTDIFQFFALFLAVPPSFIRGYDDSPALIDSQS